MKKAVFKESKIIDGEEYVQRKELDRDYDLKKSHRLFETDPETGEKRRIPGVSWKRMFYIDLSTLFIVAVVVFSFFMYQGAVEECKAVMVNPCAYCSGVIPSSFNYTGLPVVDESYINTSTTTQQVISQ